MKTLILGASGLVGGNCMRYFQSKSDMDVVGTYFSYQAEGTVPFNTLDLNAKDNFDIDAYSPDVILHCGALTWVDYCEEHVDESYQKTVQSTLNAIDLCKRYNAKLVFVSTDYIFDGTAGPYEEDAPLNPLSVYGKHKLEAEEAVKNQLPNDHLVLRITNVYGDEERGKNFVARMIQNALNPEGMALKLPFDQYATPVNAADIAKALYLLLKDQKTGVYNIASTDFVNRVQLAQQVLRFFPNHGVTLEPVDTATFNPPADRPLVGGLISKKFLAEYPHFRFTNVSEYVAEKVKEVK